MRNLKLTIEYDGTHFKGWQVQRKGERTVQAEIIKAIKKITKETVKLIGSGRTDTGVHALGQTANFHTTSNLSCEQFCKALNAHLPDDIAIINVKKVPDDFHAQYSIKSKTYCYSILNRSTRSAIYNRGALHYPHPLDITKIKEAAKILVGKHDFRSFQSNNQSNKGKNTIRTIKNLKIQKRGDFITITITADGFLYKMVRNIVGTLMEVGSGKLSKGSVSSILKAKNRKLAGLSVKPHGLSLINTTY